MNNLDHVSQSLERIFCVKILKFFEADADPNTGIFLVLDPGWKKFGSGIKKNPGCATLLATSVRILNVLKWLRILFFSSVACKMLTNYAFFVA
jgi:hypothetical protein